MNTEDLLWQRVIRERMGVPGVVIRPVDGGRGREVVTDSAARPRPHNTS